MKKQGGQKHFSKAKAIATSELKVKIITLRTINLRRDVVFNGLRNTIKLREGFLCPLIQITHQMCA